MVSLEDSWKSLTLDQFRDMLETQHLILKCWTRRVTIPLPKPHYEYEDWSEIGQVYKVDGQYFIDLLNADRRPVSLGKAYQFVRGHIAQCNGHNGLDIAEVDNSPDWVSDNSDDQDPI